MRGPVTRLTFAGFVSAIVLSAPQIDAAIITLKVHTWTDYPAGVDAMVPGDLLYYQVGVEVLDDGSNFGLTDIVYDLLGSESVAHGYQLSPLTPAASGYAEDPSGNPVPGLRSVTQPMYVDYGTTGESDWYYGGWGFDNFGLPTGGNVTETPGAILDAALRAPLIWIADVAPYWSPLHPCARLGVGHGLYRFPEPWTSWPLSGEPPGGDPVLHGLQGGFGQDLSNMYNPIEGDGTWLIHEGLIDTSGWQPQEYHFDLVPTLGSVFSPTLDYWQDQYGFRISVDEQDMAGTSFSFRLLSECDVDRDGDVDLNDFATFAVCFCGAAVTIPPPGCTPEDFEASDFDDDGDVDLGDFATLAVEYTG
jgi:hypothetical protein